jgi:hypothetical protein
MSGDFLDIGHGVSIFFMSDNTGIYWRHPGCRGASFLWFMPHEYSTGHTLISGDQNNISELTIGGSLLCPKGCGFHGCIQKGKWIPA